MFEALVSAINLGVTTPLGQDVYSCERSIIIDSDLLILILWLNYRFVISRSGIINGASFFVHVFWRFDIILEKQKSADLFVIEEMLFKFLALGIINLLPFPKTERWSLVPEILKRDHVKLRVALDLLLNICGHFLRLLCFELLLYEWVS